MISHRTFVRLGIGKSTFFITLLGAFLSVGVYLLVAGLAGQVRTFGILASFIIPILTASPPCYLLLRMSRSLYYAKQEVQKSREGLEERIAERTGELREANEQLRAEIEERKTAEQMLRTSESRFRRLSENSLSGIFIIQDGVFKYTNPAMAGMLGYGSEELSGMAMNSIVFPNDSDVLAERLQLGMEGEGGGRQHIFRACAKSGEMIYVEVLVSLIDYGNAPALLGNAIDVTERKKAEEAIRDYQENLERLVRERTAALEKEISEHKTTEQALRRSEEKYRAIFENATEGIFQTTPEGKTLCVNPAFARMFGYSSPEETLEKVTDIGRQIYADPEDRKALTRLLKEDGVVEAFEARAVTTDGRTLWISINAHEVRDEEGKLVRYEGTNQDITRRKEAEMQLKGSEERYRTAIEYSSDGIAVARGGSHLFVNRKFLEMFGYESPDEIIGDDSCKNVHPEDRDRVRDNGIRRLLGEPVEPRYEFKGLKKDGSVIFVEASVATIDYHGEPASLIFLRDITERKGLEEKLQVMSVIDELTGLYNRRGFFTLCKQQLELATRERKAMTLFFIDLDGMKWINDTLGHNEGDAALVQVTSVLRRTFRKTDIIGRMGGDEFAVLAVNTPDEEKEYLTKRLRDTLTKHNRRTPRGFTLSLSAGAATYDPDNPSSLDDLLAQADRLMYEEKWNKQRRTSNA